MVADCPMPDDRNTKPSYKEARDANEQREKKEERRPREKKEEPEEEDPEGLEGIGFDDYLKQVAERKHKAAVARDHVSDAD